MNPSRQDLPLDSLKNLIRVSDKQTMIGNKCNYAATRDRPYTDGFTRTQSWTQPRDAAREFNC
jgi:hypothetical protein